MRYYGLPHSPPAHVRVADLRWGIDRRYPTILCLQAYRTSNRPYRELWQDGHWVVAIGYGDGRILFEDPASFCRTWLAEEELLERWHDLDRGRKIRQWGCMILRPVCFQPGRLAHMD